MSSDKVAVRTIRRMKLNGKTYPKGRYLDLTPQHFSDLAPLGFIERAPEKAADTARTKRETRRQEKPAS